MLEASNSLSMGAGSEIISPWLAVAMGSGGVATQPDALLNEVWSRGTVNLAARVKVRGKLHATTVVLNPATGGGQTIASRDSAPVFDPTTSLSWTVTYPSATVPAPIWVNPPDVIPLAPGQYGSVTTNTGGTLNLSSGTYYFEELHLNSGSTINLNQADGPIILYVATSDLNLRGTMVPSPAGSPDLLVAYLGTSPVILDTRFDGAIVAPSTSVTLRAVTGVHTGFFAAQQLQVLDAHAQVQYRVPLPIITASTPQSDCQQVLASLVPPSQLMAAVQRYCKKCATFADTDLDGVQDCIDGCPYDRPRLRRDSVTAARPISTRTATWCPTVSTSVRSTRTT